MAKHRRVTEPHHPTQVRHPWKATTRVVLVAALALLPALPDLAAATDIDEIPLVVSVLMVAAMLQRVIAIPEVDRLLSLAGLGAKDRTDYLNEVHK